MGTVIQAGVVVVCTLAAIVLFLLFIGPLPPKDDRHP